MMDMSEFTGEFVAEAKENLYGIEGILMDLERTAGDPDPESVNRAFRAVHSVKGGAAFLGFTRITELSHALESLMALIRSREIRPTADVIDTLLAGIDLLNEMLDQIDRSDRYDIGESLATINEILSRELHPDVKEDLSETLPVTDETGRETGFTIDRFTQKNLDPEADLYVMAFDLNAIAASGGGTPLSLIDRLLGMGEIMDARLDVPVDDLHRDLTGVPLLYEVLLSTADPEADPGEQIGEGLRRMTRVRAGAPAGEPSPAPPAAEPGRPERAPEPAGPAAVRDQRGGIRVAEEKIDTLVTLAGEFVTVQAALTSEAKSQRNPRLLSIAERVERLSTDLRDVALSVRMQPIRTAFGRFRRLVRDLSRQHDKEVVLSTEGGGVELDKSVIERLYDPLTHIIRNSVDHAIAPPETRIARGKPGQGTISLRARQNGGHVMIDIADDGEGIDPERVRRKAVERGLISSERSIHQEALLPLIFEPGFSTAETITDLSGRGVGMDVVKRRVEALGGTVSVESQRGRGTTISLKIPLTMAIIDGLLIRIDGTRYLIPLTEMSECVDLRGKELVRARSRGAMALRGTLIPYICLTRWLAPEADPPGDEYGVVVRRDDGLVGLGVERVLGFHQAVIKPLGKAYQEANLFSGSTILGDGQVALILDVQSLIATCGKGEGQRQVSRADGF